MTIGPTALTIPTNIGSTESSLVSQKTSTETDIGLRFEQMLWAEMLTHSGLEEALTKNGGEAVSAFSRFVVESIAEDIAAQHPLGLSDAQTGLKEE